MFVIYGKDSLCQGNCHCYSFLSNAYKDLTAGGQRTAIFSQEEECAVPKAYDYGVTE